VAQEGIDGATMRKIADCANVSVGMISYYYKDKRDLIKAALADAYAKSSRDIDEVMGNDFGPQRIEALFASMLDRSRTGTFPLTFWLAYWGEAARDAEYRSTPNRGLGKLRDAFRRAVELGVESGELRHDLNPETAADIFLTLYQGARAEIGLGHVDEMTINDVLQGVLELMKEPADPAKPATSSHAKRGSRTQHE
jgi:AcrR family transcriptional regulator